MANHLVRWQSIQHLEEKTAALKLLSEKQQLDQLHPADLADLIEELDYRSRTDLIEELDVDTAAEAFAEMELDTQVEIIENLESQQALDILQEMPVDEAADLLGEMSEEKSDELLNLMEPEDAQEVRELMSYEEDTAGALMTTEYIALPPDITAAEAIVQATAVSCRGRNHLLPLHRKQTGKIDGGDFASGITHRRTERFIGRYYAGSINFCAPEDEHEKIADLLNKYGLLAIPVLAKNNKMLGIITVDDVLEILVPDRSSFETFSHFFISKRSAKG